MSWSNSPIWLSALVLGWLGWMVMDMSVPDESPRRSASMAAVATSKVPVLVEFYADWCGPCKAVGPELESLAVELGPRAQVIRINIDEQPDIAIQNGVRGIPTFIAYRQGREVQRQSGAIPKSQMREMLGL